MPFGDYKNFEDCVSKNQDKDSPEGFCAFLHKKITGKHPSEMEMTGDIMSDKEKLMKEIRFLTEEIDKKENSIQTNSEDVSNKEDNVDEPKKKDIDKADLLAEIYDLEKILKERSVTKK